MRSRPPFAAAVVILAVTHALGCALGQAARPSAESATIPGWAKHVKTTRVNTSLPFERAAADILAELRAPQLAAVHMPAEQIALAATQSLDAGHRADAAVLLAIASYRYHQQAQRVLDVGYEVPAGLKINDSAYMKLVHAEEATYQRLGFGDEQRVLAAWLRGEDALDVDADLVRRLGEIFRSRSVDEETFREVIRERLPTAADASTETPEGAALADAFLARLRADVIDKRKPLLGAAWAMARTPLPAFQTEALRFAWLPVPPRFCSAIADQLGAHRPAVVGMLADQNHATRAAAAVVLGMSPSPNQVPPLERMWETERQPLVRLAVAYALARHGRRERVRDLVAALDRCAGDVCVQAMSLLDWFPRDILLDVAEQVPAAFAGDTSRPWLTRLFAAAILRRMAGEHPLAAPSRAALFAASHDRHEELSSMALEAISRDTGLGRDEVLARLGGASPDHGPLLARLAHVATAADLPLLRRLMPRFARGDGPEATSLVDAAGAVPGPEADAQLLAWFDAYEPLRARVTLRLLDRRPASLPALREIVGRGDGRMRLLVQVALGGPDALGALDQSLRAPDPNVRLFAARLAGMVREPRTGDGLWQLVNFRDDRYYPQDALMRHQAMVSLLRIALAAHRPPPQAPKTMAALSGTPD
jgi:hypothetical protein